jgi:abortive infection bacteriophage resistance protein
VGPKPALSLTEQVERLKERGLVIEDDDAAEAYLYDTNYYRLAGFARQFQRDPLRGDNSFEPGTSLHQIAQLHVADAQFSRILARGLATIECTVRARLALHLALKHGETAFYLRADPYVKGLDDKVEDLLAGVRRDLTRDKGRTVRRYAPDPTDLGSVPIWVAIELLSFGTVSRLMELLGDQEPRDAVAESFGELRSTFPSTVHSLAVLRNRCAHHGQIWHRGLTIQTPTNGKHRHRARVRFDPHGPFAAVLAIQRMLGRVEGGADCLSVLNQFIADADPAYMDGIYCPNPK